MICHRIGAPPISIIGFGLKWLSSLILVPNPPAKITTFIPYPSNPHDDCICFHQDSLTQLQSSTIHLSVFTRKSLLFLSDNPTFSKQFTQIFTQENYRIRFHITRFPPDLPVFYPHKARCYFLLAFRYSDGDSVVKRLNTEEK